MDYALERFGDLRVYRRTKGSPKYYVMRETDAHTLEEFRQHKAAVKWAKANGQGLDVELGPRIPISSYDGNN